MPKVVKFVSINTFDTTITIIWAMNMMTVKFPETSVIQLQSINY